MKKLYSVCVLFAAFGAIMSASFATTPAEACKSFQNKALANLNNIKNCASNSSYGFNPGYLFKGMENGKCHYSKLKFESGLKINTLAECYAPTSAIQNFANDNIKAIREMCDANGMSPNGYTAVEDESSLERYCK